MTETKSPHASLQCSCFPAYSEYFSAATFASKSALSRPCRCITGTSSTLRTGQCSVPVATLPWQLSGNRDVPSQPHETGITMDSSIGNFSNFSSNVQTMGIGPQQTQDSGQRSSSAGSEQQLDQLLAMFIMMMLQQSQGSDANQECGNDQPQNGQQDGLSPLTQMLMQIVMQLMQNQGGAGVGGGGSVNSSLGGNSLGGGFNANLSSITGQA
ncbi:XopA/Hpa1 family type III secretion system protein [Xanthomonas arboricola]|uniref:XopA/Hpa1 family type III secretion system protein n=1 Tax=Xanthomonas arboricola TaxID=56448 RepID=UPI001EE12AD2|nr:XopA/Hpa1 family type III secretion system protein [Xanthomonas arboricola]